jgi:PIN domain nuclease of toxin-antitoxin system
MRVLLDTHVLLSALAEPARLDADTRSTIERGADKVLFSAANIWESPSRTGSAAPISRCRIRRWSDASPQAS